jgi:endonuclease YncB( thermonuclease family)
MPAVLVRGFFLTFLLSLCIPALTVASFTGPVISVLDGDAIEVLHHQHPERIRLSGIDCPEKGQAYGNNAKHAARPPWLSCTKPGSNVCPIGRGVVKCW